MSMLNPPESDSIIQFNVPDLKLFTEDYFESLSQAIEENPEANTIRFVITNGSKYLKSTKENPLIENRYQQMCVIDVSTTPGVSHRFDPRQCGTLVEQITVSLYAQLKPNIIMH